MNHIKHKINVVVAQFGLNQLFIRMFNFRIRRIFQNMELNRLKIHLRLSS